MKSGLLLFNQIIPKKNREVSPTIGVDLKRIPGDGRGEIAQLDRVTSDVVSRISSLAPQFKNTATYDIFLFNCREIVKNAIDAGASRLSIFFVKNNKTGNIDCICTDDSPKPFETVGQIDKTKFDGLLAKQPIPGLIDYELLSANIPSLDSSKVRGQAHGRRGRGLVQISKVLQEGAVVESDKAKVTGHLFIGKEELEPGRTRAVLLLSAPIKADREQVEAVQRRVQAEFSSEFNTDPSQSTTTAAVLQGLKGNKNSSSPPTVSVEEERKSPGPPPYKDQESPPPAYAAIAPTAPPYPGDPSASIFIRETKETNEEGDIVRIIRYDRSASLTNNGLPEKVPPFAREVEELNKAGETTKVTIYDQKGFEKSVIHFKEGKPEPVITYDKEGNKTETVFIRINAPVYGLDGQRVLYTNSKDKSVVPTIPLVSSLFVALEAVEYSKDGQRVRTRNFNDNGTPLQDFVYGHSDAGQYVREIISYNRNGSVRKKDQFDSQGRGIESGDANKSGPGHR